MWRVFPRSVSMNMVAVTLLISTIAMLYGGFRAFYYEGDFLPAISYVTDERYFVELVTSSMDFSPQDVLFGIHAFGDYLLPYSWATLDNPWSGTEPVNYPPSALVLFKALAFLPYQGSVLLYLGLSAIALMLPMLVASKGLRWSNRVILIVVLAIMTGPAIAVLDRGNTQGFIPLLLFGFAVSILRRRLGWATTFLVIAAAIKIYPLILLAVFVALRYFRWALVALITSLVVILGSLLLTASKPFDAFREMVGDFTAQGSSDYTDFMAYNVSLVGSLAHVSEFVGLSSVSVWMADNPWLVIALYVIAVLPLLWITSLPLPVRLVLAMMLTAAVLPVLYPYVLTWGVAAAALIVWSSSRSARKPGQVPAPLTRILVVAIGALLAVYPFYLPGSMESGYPVGASVLASFFAFVSIPVAMWTYAIRSRSRQPSLG
jgi:hypothetical protein